MGALMLCQYGFAVVILALFPARLCRGEGMCNKVANTSFMFAKFASCNQEGGVFSERDGI